MPSSAPKVLRTITEFCQFRNLDKPQHPLVSVIDFEKISHLRPDEPTSIVNNFYSIALKRNCNIKMKYGQREYDFDEGVMFFMAPGQVYALEGSGAMTHIGYNLVFHPDFLWNTPLGKKIKQYEFFRYSVHEALFLSDKEEQTIVDIIQKIESEYSGNMDHFSQDVIIAQLELLLTYAERFYHRQFLTRKMESHKTLDKLEKVLDDWFDSGATDKKGLPTVQYVASRLNVSPNYLSGMLKVTTGQSTQQHIHDRLIEKAKEKLAGSDLSISEIAYDLGFEHPQSFSKLFKVKTNVSPLEFRQSFN
ncbi:helix-turn-helix domain-containing protein [Flavobacterium silvaticum]|uniref:Helix-turn-helix transcriptional regulator n=1 Tax=Flavobacterium silvaticum TaxID=1852020 RepID=A0A972FSQ4_9FLAO|nr:response regulator transcription factor [Flavobacterium silvaticum]NMH26840.1 helix-turn-helix transcriptional regulator [Flavobacterium silvaticum]